MSKKKVKKSKSNRSNTIKKRIEKNQEKFLEGLDGFWTITDACNRTAINRSTYYDWLKKYPKFKQQVEALDEIHNDYVETKLIQQIKADQITAIIFYLKHRHPKYKIERMKIEGEIKSKLQLNDEQFKQLVRRIAERFNRKKSIKGTSD